MTQTPHQELRDLFLHPARPKKCSISLEVEATTLYQTPVQRLSLVRNVLRYRRFIYIFSFFFKYASLTSRILYRVAMSAIFDGYEKDFLELNSAITRMSAVIPTLQRGT